MKAGEKNMSEAKYFTQDCNMVKVLVAESRHESVDSDKSESVHAKLRELASHPTPNNRFMIAEIIGYAVDEIDRTTDNNWLPNVADVKEVGFGVHPQFQCRLEGVRAYWQAKGATTPRSKIANKAMILETGAISSRPVVNIVEMQNGLFDMAALINDAHYQMEIEELKYYQKVLLGGVGTAFQAPYYGFGTDVDPGVFDPMLRFWMRMSNGGAPAILGDIEIVHKLAHCEGFQYDQNGSMQYDGNFIGEFYRTGRVATYLGGNVINLMNPLVEPGDDFVFNKKFAFILPTFADATMRPLKVVKEGGIQTMDATNIDDQTFEVRLDRYIGAGIVYGDRPYMSIYEDKSL